MVSRTDVAMTTEGLTHLLLLGCMATTYADQHDHHNNHHHRHHHNLRGPKHKETQNRALTSENNAQRFRDYIYTTNTPSMPKPEDTQRNNYDGDEAFNLRMYWRSGFMWQESPTEKKFCLKCQSGTCSKGSGVKIAKCDRSDKRQQWFYDQGRVRSRKNTSVCLDRVGRYIELRTCNNSTDQKWDTLRKEKEFQLTPMGNDEKCASQHHHPRDGEKVYMTSCKKSRRNHTDKWIKY